MIERVFPRGFDVARPETLRAMLTIMSGTTAGRWVKRLGESSPAITAEVLN
jgi:hypothetical protein